MICYLDMDGVLTDIMTAASMWHGVANPYDEHPEELAGVYNFHGFLGRSRDEFWGTLPQDFWANIPPTPEAQQIIQIVEEHFNKIWLLTSPENHPGCVPGKQDWCRRHFPQYVDRIIPESRKWKYAQKDTVLIDDYHINVEKFKKSGGHGILFPRLWNPLHSQRHAPIDFLLVELERILA